MRLKPSKGLRWRVSFSPPGVDANLPTDWPLRHHASRNQETAQAHYDRYRAQVGKGEIGRVIMHQGLLYRGDAQYLHRDTHWERPRTAEQIAAAAEWAAMKAIPMKAMP